MADGSMHELYMDMLSVFMRCDFVCLPEVILQDYDRKELRTILLHEKTHIRLGHLWCYLLWDILRILLWLNPFLSTGMKYFREDMEEMQNNPEKEKEMKELIQSAEAAVNMLDSVCKASGWTVIFKHCYINENGKFCSIAYLRNDFVLNMSDELREERRENAEKLLERQKENAAERKEESFDEAK